MIEHRPWVGDRYATEGIAGQRIGIVGYSAYTCDDREDYTIYCVRQVVSGEDPTMRFFNAIPDYFEKTPADFYSRVIFFEFVPCAVGCPEQKYAVAKPEQAEAGRRRVLKIAQDYRNQKLLIFSSKAWHSMPQTIEAAEGAAPRLPGTDFRMGTYELSGLRTTAIGLRHTQFAPKIQMRMAVQAALALPV